MLQFKKRLWADDGVVNRDGWGTAAKDAKAVIFNFGFLMLDYRRVRMWKSVKVVLKFEAQVGAASPRPPNWANKVGG